MRIFQNEIRLEQVQELNNFVAYEVAHLKVVEKDVLERCSLPKRRKYFDKYPDLSRPIERNRVMEPVYRDTGISKESVILLPVPISSIL